VAWLVAVGSFVISFLLVLQSSIWVISRPWYASLLGWVYPACGLLTLVAIGVALRRRPALVVEKDAVAAAANAN
jgi:alpha-1,2-mannosyltransferase